MGIDLTLRYFVIAIAAHLACSWMHSFQSPWPLTDAFELANDTEEQLFQSLGFSLRNLKKSYRLYRRGGDHAPIGCGANRYDIALATTARREHHAETAGIACYSTYRQSSAEPLASAASS